MFKKNKNQQSNTKNLSSKKEVISITRKLNLTKLALISLIFSQSLLMPISSNTGFFWKNKPVKQSIIKKILNNKILEKGKNLIIPGLSITAIGVIIYFVAKYIKNKDEVKPAIDGSRVVTIHDVKKREIGITGFFSKFSESVKNFGHSAKDFFSQKFSNNKKPTNTKPINYKNNKKTTIINGNIVNK